MTVRRDLYLKAVEVAALLNAIEDDEERALQRELFENTLGLELRLGEQNREIAREWLARRLTRKET